MYWSRTGNPLDLLAWIVLAGLMWGGGWLICAHLFHLRSRERLLTGLAAGLLLFITSSNVFSFVFPVQWAFWVAGVLVFTVGVAAAIKGGSTEHCGGERRVSKERLGFAVRSSFGSRLPWQDWRAWPQLLILIVLLALFVMIGRGLAIFDDDQNLPLVSTIAAGSVRLAFNNPTQDAVSPSLGGKEYGLHILAASLVRVAGLFPWSAWDLSKALMIALMPLLVGLWVNRMTRSRTAAILGGALALLGGGTRWLLLFFPVSSLIRISSSVRLLGSALDSGPDLYTNLGRAWLVEGAGPNMIPFAFANGIFTPLPLALGAQGAFPWVTMLVLLLLLQRRWRPIDGLVYGLLLSSLALTSEVLFILVSLGIVLAALVHSRKAAHPFTSDPGDPIPGRPLRKGPRFIGEASISWSWVLLPALFMAFFSGGMLSELARRLLGFAPSSMSQNLTWLSMTLRWPPMVVSAHLGELSLLNPGQALVALVEMGPALFLTIWATVWAWRQGRRDRLLLAGLSFFMFSVLVYPLIFSAQGQERYIARLIGSALYLGLILSFSSLWLAWQRRRNVPCSPAPASGRSRMQGNRRRYTVALVEMYLLTCLGGIVVLAFQLTAIPEEQLTSFVTQAGARLSRQFWDRLPPDAKILDILPERSATLFGRVVHIGQGHVRPEDESAALTANPDPVAIARAGFDYVYVDSGWWGSLRADQKKVFDQPCVIEMAEELLDVHDCR